MCNRYEQMNFVVLWMKLRRDKRTSVLKKEEATCDMENIKNTVMIFIRVLILCYYHYYSEITSQKNINWETDL